MRCIVGSLGILGGAAVLGLSGCASDSTAIGETVRAAIYGGSSAESALLNPDFRYLRITTGGRVALLVLGYVEDDARGPIEVWYSAERETLTFQNGRLIGAAGTLSEWRAVEVRGAPAWETALRSESPAKWERTRDVMPGYRYGLRETLTTTRTSPPDSSALRDLDPKALTWFEERSDALPVARYAVRLEGGRPIVIYGEQCLSREICFTWQRWPAGK